MRVQEVGSIDGDRKIDKLARSIVEAVDSSPEDDGLRGIVLLYDPETNAATLMLAGYEDRADAIKDAERLPVAIKGGE